MLAREALDWMKDQVGAPGCVLFRGQNRVWPSIKPSITRDDNQTTSEMWQICRRFQTAASGIGGYSIPKEHDRLAILQHYILRSPVIDLTGTPEIALYFAILGAEPESECVVYSLNRSAPVSSEVVFSDHFFLALPFEDGGLRHRWLRQDGYSVGPSKWRDPDVVSRFDLLKLPGVESRRFTTYSNDRDLITDLGDLEDISSDPLAFKVRGMVVAIARSLELLTPGIQRILQSSKTQDPDEQLATEIEGLIALASLAQAPRDVIADLQKLRSFVGTACWNTSFAASLDSMRRQIARFMPGTD